MNLFRNVCGRLVCGCERREKNGWLRVRGVEKYGLINRYIVDNFIDRNKLIIFS